MGEHLSSAYYRPLLNEDLLQRATQSLRINGPARPERSQPHTPHPPKAVNAFVTPLVAVVIAYQARKKKSANHPGLGQSASISCLPLYRTPGRPTLRYNILWYP